MTQSYRFTVAIAPNLPAPQRDALLQPCAISALNYTKLSRASR